MSDQTNNPRQTTDEADQNGAYTPSGGSLRGARIAGAVFLLFGLVVSYRTVGIISEGGVAPSGPGFFPLIISVGLVLFGIIFLIQSFTSPDAALLEAVSDEEEKTDWRKFGALIAALILYAFLLAPLGYIISTTLFFVGAARVMGSRKLVRDIIVGIIFAAGIYFGFTELLSVRLPAGIFPGGLF